LFLYFIIIIIHFSIRFPSLSQLLAKEFGVPLSVFMFIGDPSIEVN